MFWLPSRIAPHAYLSGRKRYISCHFKKDYSSAKPLLKTLHRQTEAYSRENVMNTEYRRKKSFGENITFSVDLKTRSLRLHFIKFYVSDCQLFLIFLLDALLEAPLWCFYWSSSFSCSWMCKNVMYLSVGTLTWNRTLWSLCFKGIMSRYENIRGNQVNFKRNYE